MGGTVLGAELFIQTGCKTTPEKEAAEAGVKALPDFFTKDEIAYLDEIAETILPKTATPGAKDAKVGEFMNVMVRDCYTPEDQKIFKDGIETLEKRSKEKYSNGFMQMQPQQRTELLTALDKEAKEFNKTDEYKAKKEALAKEEHIKDSIAETKGNFGYAAASMPKHYFSMMKELTLLGFFTSEPGATKALRYAAVPGKYDPCMPYKTGDKAWAT
ncbi:gluconate 2-dehydrogenase subunit 3 family protein [Niabella ginsengisoli]|uniref:Gluconate 2-dehydrogenase subunit 3 family protein n=1 Tax=Niabella ginsengisoli TaxID=522298 RepID=A0ABS9SE09_9BACT|nr:gluconate 2-dehydrogenase subunit 3 family protein [Niabella ginsengisoli]MCH5596596.1 gluconate 2-dehydrogenase subunit 3 family protein [Niabella ginsengisoli]